MASRYTPGGKANRILRRLAEGPAPVAELADLIRGPEQTMHGAKTRAHRFVTQLRVEGFIVDLDLQYRLTAAGRALIAELDGDVVLDTGTPNVRLFEREPQ